MPSSTMADSLLCFVISPIGEEGSPGRRRADNLVDYILGPVLTPLGFEVARADHLAQPGSITSLVIEKVINSNLVVADLTGRNPNVYYELALRHAVQKPYVQLIDSNEAALPFDIKDESTIKFDITDLKDVDYCKIQLKKHVEAVLAPGFQVTTPIGRALQLQSTMQAGGETAVILSTIEDLRKEIAGRSSTSSSNQDTSLTTRLSSEVARKMKERAVGLLPGIEFQIDELDRQLETITEQITNSTSQEATEALEKRFQSLNVLLHQLLEKQRSLFEGGTVADQHDHQTQAGVSVVANMSPATLTRTVG